MSPAMVVPLIFDDPPETLIACRKVLESDDEMAASKIAVLLAHAE